MPHGDQHSLLRLFTTNGGGGEGGGGGGGGTGGGGTGGGGDGGGNGQHAAWFQVALAKHCGGRLDETVRQASHCAEQTMGPGAVPVAAKVPEAAATVAAATAGATAADSPAARARRRRGRRRRGDGGGGKGTAGAVQQWLLGHPREPPPHAAGEPIQPARQQLPSWPQKPGQAPCCALHPPQHSWLMLLTMSAGGGGGSGRGDGGDGGGGPGGGGDGGVT